MGAWGVIANQVGTRRVSALFDQALAQADADSAELAALAALVSNLRLERGASHPA